jgi:hypothetical protein
VHALGVDTSRMLCGLRSPCSVLLLCMNLSASAMSRLVSSAQSVGSIEIDILRLRRSISMSVRVPCFSGLSTR